MRNDIRSVVLAASLLAAACGPMTWRSYDNDTGVGWGAGYSGALLLPEWFETRGQVTRAPNGVFHITLPTVRAREYAGLGGSLGECRWPAVWIRDRFGREQRIPGRNLVCPQTGTAFAGGGTVFVSGEFDFEAEPVGSDWLARAEWEMLVLGGTDVQFSVPGTFFDGEEAGVPGAKGGLGSGRRARRQPPATSLDRLVAGGTEAAFSRRAPQERHELRLTSSSAPPCPRCWASSSDRRRRFVRPRG